MLTTEVKRYLPLLFFGYLLDIQCYFRSSVAFSHGAVGWPAVCDCGIS